MTGCLSADVGWLMTLDTLPFAALTEALDALKAAEKLGMPLAFDVESRIAVEYGRYLKPETLGRRFITNCEKTGLVSYQSGSPSGVCKATLDSLGFDPSDVPYVAALQHCGSGFFLTTEEKHLQPTVTAKLLADCGVASGGAAELATYVSARLV